MKKITVYTAVFGDFEKVFAPTVLGDARYICFSDGCEVEEPWELVKVASTERTPRRDARKYKALSHIFVPDVDYTVWVDGNIRIQAPPEKMLEWLEGNDIAARRHLQRKTLYAEVKACKDYGLWPEEPFDAQADFYQQEGCPETTGLFETQVVIRRHTEKIEKLNEAWWEQLQKYSCRDQVGFPYVLWKTGVTCSIIPIVSLQQSKEFRYSCHGKGR